MHLIQYSIAYKKTYVMFVFNAVYNTRFCSYNSTVFLIQKRTTGTHTKQTRFCLQKPSASTNCSTHISTTTTTAAAAEMATTAKATTTATAITAAG